MLRYTINKPDMGFLGNLASFGRKFIGHASKAATFLGRHIPNIQSGIRSVQNFVAHPDVQRIGREVGIAPGVFTTAGQVASTLNNGLGLLPQLGSDLRTGFNTAMGAIQPSTKRSLADLYSQANQIGS
jgi:hypothetical protein